MITDPAIREIAETVLTRKQHVIWELHHHTGMGFRRMALHLNLSRTTVVDHYDAACKNLRDAGVLITPDGTHYLNGDKP